MNLQRDEIISQTDNIDIAEVEQPHEEVEQPYQVEQSHEKVEQSHEEVQQYNEEVDTVIIAKKLRPSMEKLSKDLF